METLSRGREVILGFHGGSNDIKVLESEIDFDAGLVSTYLGLVDMRKFHSGAGQGIALSKLCSKCSVGTVKMKKSTNGKKEEPAFSSTHGESHSTIQLRKTCEPFNGSGTMTLQGPCSDSSTRLRGRTLFEDTL